MSNTHSLSPATSRSSQLSSSFSTNNNIETYASYFALHELFQNLSLKKKINELGHELGRKLGGVSQNPNWDTAYEFARSGVYKFFGTEGNQNLGNKPLAVSVSLG